MHTKPSVIRTHCTPLDTLLAGSTPGLSRQKRGKIKKIWCKMHHSCTISGRKPPQTRMRPPRFPLSCNHPPDGSCHRWRGGKAGEARKGQGARKLRGSFTKAPCFLFRSFSSRRECASKCALLST